MIFILDSNVISEYIRRNPNIVSRVRITLLNETDEIALVPPVYYEVYRGLLKRQASAQLRLLKEEIATRLEWLPLEDRDWIKAAEFWAETKSKGLQLSEVDLLIAAMTVRVNGF